MKLALFTLNRRHFFKLMPKRSLIILLSTLLLSIVYFQGYAQVVSQHEVTGTVVSENGEPLPGVSVVIKGTTTRAVTDADGNYSLNVPNENSILKFSSVGYLTQEIKVNGRSVINVQLTPSQTALNQIVVVGYGTQKKANLTGAVGTVSGENLSNQPAIQASSALIGKLAGVTVRQNSGRPGSTANIKIRGIGTLNNSNPLVLIDGIPGNLSDVAPSNIASVTVLKDAASAAIYGSRAANGVILVKTKRGKKGAVQVHYDGYIGWQNPARLPNFVDGYEYMKYRNMALENVGRQPLYSQDYMDQWQKKHLTDPDHYPNTDWINALFTEPGLQQKQHLSISGGSDKATYFASLTYDNKKGNIPNFGYKRYAIRLNTNINASEKWHFNFDVNAIKKDQKTPPHASFLFTQIFRLSPILVARYSDGSLGPGLRPRQPVAFANAAGLHTLNSSIFKSRISALYEPINGLELELIYSPIYRDAFHKNVNKQFSIYDIDTKDLLYKAPAKSSISESDSKRFYNNLNFTVKYKTNVNGHQFRILGGYEFNDLHYKTFSASRDNLSLQDFEELNVGALDNQQNSGSGSAYALQSVFGRFNYNYKSKYLFEANVRYDGSSRFAQNNRYGLFPSFSAGWRLSNEPFLKGVNFISNLKIRASWGQLGNQEIGTYPYQAVINLNQHYMFGGTPVSAAAQLDLANTQISWETTEMTDVGLDVSLWQDRFNFTFDYYQKKTRDILLRLPIPMFIGLNAPYQNAGNVKNTGWELSASYQNNVGDFNYALDFNISDVHNEVTDLHGAGPFIDGNSIIKVGSPINSIYGYVADGYFDSQEEIDESAKQTGNIGQGDIKYKNLDKSNEHESAIINANDKTIIGNPFPRYSYGFNISASYKGFSLSAMFQGVGKKDILLRHYPVWAFYGQGNMSEWQKDYWTPNNKDAAYPRLTEGSATLNNFQTSTFWVYNAAYLRLRNLQIGYTIPVKWIQALSIKKLEIYFLGQNLFTGLDNMPPGVSPNVPNSTGGGFFPVTKVYTFGIDLNF